jgi:hypothetical protein
MKAPHKQHHTTKRIYDRLEELYLNEFNAHEISVGKFVVNGKISIQVSAANQC